MSNEIVPESATSKSEKAEKGKRRTTVPEVLRHQKSFESRYSHIIHKQILETSINREELQRQLNAYFPMSRSASLQTNAADERRNEYGRNEPAADIKKIAKESETSQENCDEKLLEVTEGYVKQQNSPKDNNKK